MTPGKVNQQLLQELRDHVSQYLDNNVNKPSMETIEKDLFAQNHLAIILILVNSTVDIVHKEGNSFDEEFLKGLSKEKIEKRIEILGRFLDAHDNDEMIGSFDEQEVLEYLDEDSSKKYLLPYLTREINWIAISILSASYVSSLILMRPVFELLVGMATKHTGRMSERIDKITFLNDMEKKNVKKLWRRLCAWGHPYGKWLKEVCPAYAAHHPLYHPKLCELCLEELTKIVDLFLLIAISKYKVNSSKVRGIKEGLDIDLSNFEMFASRIRT